MAQPLCPRQSAERADFPGATYEELAGEAEIWSGVHVVPTPDGLVSRLRRL
ncbi:hypothetical protein AB0M05_24685 [Streptomyces violaceusniger]